MFKKYFIIFILIITFKITDATDHDIPIQFEVTEDAINLFLLKQYNDLGEYRYIQGTFNGEDYYIGLMPFTIDLLDDEIRLNWGFEIQLSLFPSLIEFTDVITFEVPSGRTTVKLIFQQFESLVNSLNLPDEIEIEIINRFENLQLFAYYDDFIKDVQDETFYKQHPVELKDPYFVFSWDTEIDKLIFTITTKLAAEAPKMEIKIIDNSNLTCRLNFDGKLEYIYFNNNNTSENKLYYDLFDVHTYTEEHDVWFSYENLDDYFNCVVYVITDTHVYQGYFDIDAVSTGVWIEPFLLIK